MEDREEMWFSLMPIMYFRSHVYHHSVWQAKTLLSAIATPQQIHNPLIMPKYINTEKYAHIGCPADDSLCAIFSEKNPSKCCDPHRPKRKKKIT